MHRLGRLFSYRKRGQREKLEINSQDQSDNDNEEKEGKEESRVEFAFSDVKAQQLADSDPAIDQISAKLSHNTQSFSSSPAVSISEHSQGEQGEHSDQGEQGEHSDQGEQAEHSDQGEQVEHSDQGEQAEHSDQGEQGEHSDQGENSEQGEQVELRIESMNDEELISVADRQPLMQQSDSHDDYIGNNNNNNNNSSSSSSSRVDIELDDEDEAEVNEPTMRFAHRAANGFCNEAFVCDDELQHSQHCHADREFFEGDHDSFEDFDDVQADDEDEEEEDEESGDLVGIDLLNVLANHQGNRQELEDHNVEQKCKTQSVGIVRIQAKHDPKKQTLTLSQPEVELKPLFTKFRKKGNKKLKWDQMQICLTLLPDKKQKYRTAMVQHKLYKKNNIQLPLAASDKPAAYKKSKLPVKDITAFTSDNHILFAPIYASQLKQTAVTGARLAIRFRVYGCARKRRSYLLGENTLPLYLLNHFLFKSSGQLQLPLEERRFLLSKLSGQYDSDDSEDEAAVKATAAAAAAAAAASSKSGKDKTDLEIRKLIPPSPITPSQSAEIYIGLNYHQISGNVQVEIIKACNIYNPKSSKLPNCYTKIKLLWGPFPEKNIKGRPLFSSKTQILQSSCNPFWRETFAFPVSKVHLDDVSLMLRVCCKQQLSRTITVGWVSFGRNNCNNDLMDHWTEMKSANGEQICRWHILLPVGDEKNPHQLDSE